MVLLYNIVTCLVMHVAHHNGGFPISIVNIQLGYDLCKVCACACTVCQMHAGPLHADLVES